MSKTRRPRGRAGWSDRGAVALEFALCLLPLVYLLCGTVDFARAYNTHIVLTQVAAEGARALAVPNTSSSDAISASKAAVTGSVVSASSLSFPTAKTCPSTGTGQAQMTVTTSFSMITPIPVVKKQFTLTGVGAQKCGS